MRQLYLALIILVLLVHHSTAQTSYSQYFDGEDTSAYYSINISTDNDSLNTWQIGVPNKMIFDSAATFPNVIVTDTINFYPVNDSSSFIATIYFNEWNWGIFALQWKQKLDMDQGLDGGRIEFSLDAGSSWENVFNNPYVYNFYGFETANADTLPGGEFVFSGTDSSWRDIWLCFDVSWLSHFDYGDTMLFRFTCLSDPIESNKEGWMLDNMLAHVTYIHTVKEIPKDVYLEVFPNPANDIVHVEAEKIMDFHIIEKMQLVDALGRIVEEWSNIPTKFWFDTGKYNSGLYFLKVKTNIRSETIPLVISK